MENVEKNLLGETSYDYIKRSFELKNSKLYKEAIEMLYKALGCTDVGDGSLEIISQIGDLYFILKNHDRAIEQYQKALEMDKTHAHSLFQLCEIYFSQKKFEDALNLIKELCKNSGELENFIKYFKILYELKHFEEINTLYSSINFELKDNPEILYIMALCSNYNKRELLEKVLEKEAGNLKAKFDVALIHFQEENFDYSMKLFGEIVEKKENKEAFYYLGVISFKKGNYANAITNFSNALKIEPINALYYFELSKAYVEIGWLNEAQICIQKSIELAEGKNCDEKFYILSTIHFQNKNYKNALLALGQITNNSEFKNEVEILEYCVKFQTGDILHSKNKLENLLENNSENPLLLSTLGKIYKELSDTKKAIKIYELALQFYPNSIEYRGELIDVLIDDKKYERAYELAQGLKNTNPKAICAYNSLARIYYRKKEYQNALNELKQLTCLDINSAEPYYFMGLILNDINEPKLAIDRLKEAIGLSPEIAKYYFQLARAFELEENLNDAFLYSKEACMLTPYEPMYIKKAYEIAKKIGDIEAEKFYSSKLNILEKQVKRVN